MTQISQMQRDSTAPETVGDLPLNGKDSLPFFYLEYACLLQSYIKNPPYFANDYLRYSL